MNFSEALYKMKEGKKVKNEFSNKRGYLYMFLDKEKGIMIRTLNDESDEVYENLSTKELLSEDWEIYEEPKWKPKEKELYFYITSNGDIEFSYYKNKSINDKRRVCKFGNYFKTDEEAEHMVEKLKVIRELQELAFKDSNKKIIWDDYNQDKYFISYDWLNLEIFIGTTERESSSPFQTYFISKKACEEAITKIGKERLEKYYFDIKEKEEIK